MVVALPLLAAVAIVGCGGTTDTSAPAPMVTAEAAPAPAPSPTAPAPTNDPGDITDNGVDEDKLAEERQKIDDANAAAEDAMTTSQEQAVGSAEDYLDYGAFSRLGLIDQLSSDAGEGFSKKDAIYAVDHIDVNWKEQAAKSAKEYLDYGHFSRSGLIEQLESPYGEQFTHSQAVYGVDKAGL